MGGILSRPKNLKGVAAIKAITFIASIFIFSSLEQENDDENAGDENA